MSGPLSWWANRKSRMGLKPSAKAPPHKPGKPWWTEPPTTMPLPEHIEYVAQFYSQLLLQPGSKARNAMQRQVSLWMRAVKTMMHEERHSPDRMDLATTDGLIVAAASVIAKMRGRIYGLGGEVTPDVQEICEAIHGRAERIRRLRAQEVIGQRRVKVVP